MEWKGTVWLGEARSPPPIKVGVFLLDSPLCNVMINLIPKGRHGQDRIGQDRNGAEWNGPERMGKDRIVKARLSPMLT